MARDFSVGLNIQGTHEITKLNLNKSGWKRDFYMAGQTTALDFQEWCATTIMLTDTDDASGFTVRTGQVATGRFLAIYAELDDDYTGVPSASEAIFTLAQNTGAGFLGAATDTILFNDTHASQIISFIDKVNLREEDSALIIHCAAGVSRSGAVGVFANDYLDLSYSKLIKGSPQILPNVYILSLLRRKADVVPKFSDDMGAWENKNGILLNRYWKNK